MRHSRGFTLIELIIYVGIFSVAATLLTGVLTTATRVQLRQSATIEVSQQAQFVIQTVQRLVTDASLIELTKDASVSTLKLRMPVAANDPTCIQFSNGTVYLMQGNDGVNKQSCFATSTAQAKTLTSSKVVVNSLTFKKFENPPSTDTVKIDLTVSYNSTNPQESAISRTLQTAIAKVSAATFDSDIIPSADTSYNVGIGGQRWGTGFFSTSLLVGYTSVTGGVAVFNGNVGIGTTGPLAPLDVAGGAAGDRTLLYLGEPGDHTYGFVFRNNNADGVLKLYSLAASVQSTNPVMSWSRPTGNVGIGTASPSLTGTGIHIFPSSGDAMMKVQGGTSGNAYFTGSPASGGNMYVANAGYGNLYLGACGAACTSMIVDGAGSVGIGNTSPTTTLHVGASADTTGKNIRVSSDSGDMSIFVQGSAEAGAHAGFGRASKIIGQQTSYPMVISNNATQAIVFGTNDTERMRITGTGYVGIGTTPASSIGYNKVLTIGGASSPALNLIASGLPQESAIATDGSGLYLDVAGNAAATANDVIFRTGRTNSSYTLTEAMRIDGSTGDVGIGTADPGMPLDVRRTTAGSGLRIQAPSGQGAQIALLDTTNNLNKFIRNIGGQLEVVNNAYNSVLFVIADGGNVGIGTAGPTYQLQLSTDSAGKPNGGSWANSSDARLKTDIAPISNGLERLLKLDPVSFSWRNPDLHGGVTQSGGFLAQDVMREFPSWVTQIGAAGADKALVGSDGKAYSLTLPFEYDAMVISAIRELKAENEALKERIKALEEQAKER